MITYSRVTEQPANEPVSLSDAKVHLEYTGTAKNAYITSLIKSARRICEGYSGLSFVTQTRQIKMDIFPSNGAFILVPYGPVQSIESFTYLNDDGTTTTMVENTDFIADYHSSVCRLFAVDENGEIDSWPTDLRDRPQAITISYVAGYDEAINEPLPELVKQAILLQVASMFENRQDEVAGSINMMNWNTINWNSIHLLDSVKVSWNANVD
jgi:uncharacterized phiE125 gp8 family phage protein